jgi:hypothetical protein
MNLRIQLAMICNFFRFIMMLTKVVSVSKTGFVNFMKGQIVEQIILKTFKFIKGNSNEKIFALRNC